MYTCGYDKEKALYVALWRGATNTSEDWIRISEDVLRLGRESRGHPGGAAIVVDVSAENAPPNSTQRKLLFDAWRTAFEKATYHLAVVTTSTAARYILTAMTWFMRKSDGSAFTLHAGFDAGVAWLETRRPGIGPPLAELHQQALDQAAKPRGTIATSARGR